MDTAVYNIVCFSGPSKPNKPGQKTLDQLFVKGSAQHVAQAKRIGKIFYTHSHSKTLYYKLYNYISNICLSPAIQSGNVSGCSDEFKTLMSVMTPGALQLKKHLTHNQTGTKEVKV